MDQKKGSQGVETNRLDLSVMIRDEVESQDKKVNKKQDEREKSKEVTS